VVGEGTKSIICKIKITEDERTCLTDPAANNYSPNWSPDGNSIAYISSTERRMTDLFVMDAEGGNPIKLSKTSHFAWEPVWSPDGSKIAYFSVTSSGSFSVITVAGDGSNENILAWDQNHAAFAPLWFALKNKPDWSPDGTRLAFVSGHENYRLEVYVIEVASATVNRLTNASGVENLYPIWSPDGSKLAFYALHNQRWDLYTMNPDGTNPVKLADGVANQAFFVISPPSWSPDGNQIVYQSDMDGEVDIYITDVTGGNQKKLVDTKFIDEGPAWSPNGEMITFTSRPQGNASSITAIYVVNVDGSGLKMITKDTEKASDPGWLP
jgi:TolB protein